MPVPAPILVTVAICTRNRRDSLVRAAESVLPQLTAKTELLIVDNGSTDGTSKAAQMLQQRDARVRYAVEPRKGLACARNAALSKALGTYLLLIDDDEVAVPDWLEYYVRFLESSSSAGVAAVGGPYIASHTAPTPAWVRPNYGLFDLEREEGPLPHGENLAGGNCAYHRERALSLGGFAENLLRSDDSEMNSRLQRAGWTAWWLPKASVYHIIGPERFRVGYQLRIAFAEGRDRAVLSSAIFTPRVAYPLYVLARIVIAPAHFLLLLLISLIQICRGNIAFSVESMAKIGRYVGMIREWFRPGYWRKWSRSAPSQTKEQLGAV